MKRYAILLLVGAAAILGLVYHALSTRSFPLRVGGDSYFHGHIEQGEKFGFRVGERYRRNPAAERDRNLRFTGVHPCRGTYKVISGCNDNSSHASYVVSHPLYHGQVFVALDAGGAIRAVVWNADILPMK